MGDGAVELIAIGCLDDVVHVIYILRRENTNEIARVANGLYLIKSGKRTDYGIRRLEVLSLHKRAYVPVVPLLVGQHRPDAEGS